MSSIRCSTISQFRQKARQRHRARARFGRIAIANSDAGAAAYTDSAIDQAHERWMRCLRFDGQNSRNIKAARRGDGWSLTFHDSVQHANFGGVASGA